MKRPVYNSGKKGFTILEVMVVVTIVSLIASVVIFSYRQFTEKLALSAATQEIAIAVRQAQTYGRSVKEVKKGGGDFNTPYGVAFDISTADTRSYYILFTDNNNNGVYNGDGSCSPSSECVEKDIIRNGAYISEICGSTGGSFDCAIPVVRSMTVTFVRPDRDAFIYFIDSGGNPIGGPYQTVKIKLSVPSGSQSAFVVVDKNGQISTQ